MAHLRRLERTGSCEKWHAQGDRVLEKLGIVAAEELLKGGGSPFFQGVDALDQAKDVGGHDQEVAGGAWAGIPIGVGSSTGNQDRGAGLGFHVVVANLDDEGTF